MQPTEVPFKFYSNWFLAILICLLLPMGSYAQDNSKNKKDTANGLININDTKLIKSINKILDTNQKVIKSLFYNKANKIQAITDSAVNSTLKKGVFREIEKPLPYERLLNTKYTLGRRAYQNTVSQFNYLFNAEEEFKENIQKARQEFQDDFTSLIGFYDYDLSATAKHNLDSIVYRCNANIVLHDLRSNYVDDAYLLLAKAYLFHKNFDTAASILQFINYSFDEKENGADLLVGSNIRSKKGKFSIATSENNRLWENVNVRNESLLWQARNYFEMGNLNEGMSLLQLLKSDASFPKRLVPFLNEQMAYGYYLMEVYDKAAASLEEALPNAMDEVAKARWYYLIAQLWQKSENWNKAYTWYKKAEQSVNNPIVGVYAKIAIITIDSKNTNTPWIDLAYSLEKIIKREKFKPYTDIIYFEMAKLAIQNKAYTKATDWLIYSIKKNYTNLKQKQKSFELLATINYDINEYTISKIAYDSLQVVLKTNPNFETIQLRKKWMKDIEINDKIIKTQDTLQYIYNLTPAKQEMYAKAWQKRQVERNDIYKNLFADKNIISSKDYVTEPNINATLVNNYNSLSSNTDFYFNNKNTIQQGKQSFVRKWGERPNVDQWRRKTSSTILYANKQNGASNQSQISSQFLNVSADSNGKLSRAKENDSLPIPFFKSETEFASSMTQWNKAALNNAQLFLQQLNDFEKAYPYYLSIINRNIDPITTERAMLDLASHYLHDNKTESADSIIQIVIAKFPTGFYITKKNEALTKKNKDNSLVENYKEAYFLTQIGNWEQLSLSIPLLNSSLRGSKWQTPYQFLKVKMYAQQRNDSLAIKLLDTIISNNRIERIRDKAKIILEEISKRAEIEKYLDTLKIKKEITKEVTKEIKELPFVSVKEEPNLLKTVNPSQQNNKPDSSLLNVIEFVNDSIETHYIALITNKVSASFVKEIQNAFNILNNDEFSKQKLNVTYIQFDNLSYIVWIGSFNNRQSATNYLNKVKPRLSKEILSFVPTKQYQMYLLGKSNILLIKGPEDLKKYEQFMIKNFYKP